MNLQDLSRIPPSRVRNICILAHVDHGKTTIADSLISGVGLISLKLVGKLRFMDNTEEEQKRGITIKASGITLTYKGCKADDSSSEIFVINLLDSPGHVDFSSEVGSAIKLSDGALIIIDVVEGPCSQTYTVLRQAWMQGLVPLLILNKMDRLITELKMSPFEAYMHIKKIIEQMNLFVGEMMSSKIFSDIENDEYDDSDSYIYFCPSFGNVLFASAVNGWAFSIANFADIFAAKYGFNKKVLLKTLWGDYYINKKDMKIKKGAFNLGKSPLFVVLILQNVWSLYNHILKKNIEQVEKVLHSLSIQHSRSLLKISEDTSFLLSSIFSSWLPIAKCLFDSICSILPSAAALRNERISKIIGIPYQKVGEDEFVENITKVIKECRGGDDDPVFAIISKVFSVPAKSIFSSINPLAHSYTHDQTFSKYLSHEEILRKKMATKIAINQIRFGEFPASILDEEKENLEFEFLSLARVLSGKVKRDQTYYVFTSDQSTDAENTLKAKCEGLYSLIGRDYNPIAEAGPGSIVGLFGRDIIKSFRKSAILTSFPNLPKNFFTSSHLAASPIIHVSIEPQNPGELALLLEGLELLTIADTCAKFKIEENGEIVLSGAGELHLQHCLTDLKEIYTSNLQFIVSAPIVPFRETIVESKTRIEDKMISDAIRIINLEDGFIEYHSNNSNLIITMKCIPLPAVIAELIEEYYLVIKNFIAEVKARSNGELSKNVYESVKKFKDELNRLLSSESSCQSVSLFNDSKFIDKIWAFGPKGVGANVLVNEIDWYKRHSFLDIPLDEDKMNADSAYFSRYLDSSVVSGFELAVKAGPLSEEPLRSVCFIVKNIQNRCENEVNLNNQFSPTLQEHGKNAPQTPNIQCDTNSDSSAAISNVSAKNSSYITSPLSLNSAQSLFYANKSSLPSLLMLSVKNACIQGLASHSVRLVLAMYTCNIQVHSQSLGKIYAIIGKRCGEVIKEELQDGTTIFNVKATIPVIESLGLSQEILVKTSGFALPQLVFTHWKILDEDPFWVPYTTEEITHYGEKSDYENKAKAYMNKIRQRKGLHVEKKIVECAEKQRTLGKNK